MAVAGEQAGALRELLGEVAGAQLGGGVAGAAEGRAAERGVRGRLSEPARDLGARRAGQAVVDGEVDVHVQGEQHPHQRPGLAPPRDRHDVGGGVDVVEDHGAAADDLEEGEVERLVQQRSRRVPDVLQLLGGR
ncbi:hypothetical protein GCM10020001_115480 [Nonomuraea salmonea]